jgi:hypothetical protein
MALTITAADLGDANEAIEGAKRLLDQAKSDQAELERASNALQHLISSILPSQQSADQGFSNREPSEDQRTTRSLRADAPDPIAQLRHVLRLTIKVKENAQHTGEASDRIAAQAQSLLDAWELSTVDDISENQNESRARCPDDTIRTDDQSLVVASAIASRPAATTMSVRPRRAAAKTGRRGGKRGDQEDSEGENEDAGEDEEEEPEHVKGNGHGPQITDPVVEVADSQSRKTSDSSTAKGSSPSTHFDVPSFVCRVSNLSENLASTSQIYSCDPRVQEVGMAHVRVEDFSAQLLPPISAATIIKDQAHITYNTFVPGTYGTVQLCSERPSRDELQRLESVVPDFAHASISQDLSDSQLRQIFDDFCEKPPTDSLCYLIGPTSIVGKASQYQELLSAGPCLKAALVHSIPGVSESYLYISCSNQQTATNMHFEDGGLFSANLVGFGKDKLWLAIEPSSTTRFEACLEQYFPGELSKCSQKVRHLSKIFPPRLLEEWGVRYHIKACKPGAFMFTIPKTYHQIINMGSNFAESVNFITDDAPVVPDGYVFCRPNICAEPYPISEKNFVSGVKGSKKRKTTADDATTLSKKRRVMEELQRNSLGVGEHLIHDFHCGTPASVILSITSRRTVTRLFALIESRRRACFATTAHRSCIFTLDSASRGKKLATYDRNAAALANQAECRLLEARLNEYMFAEMIDDMRDKDMKRLSSDKLDELFKEMQQEGSKIQTRQSLNDVVLRRTKLIHLCGDFGKGLLPLLPLSSESPYFVTRDRLMRLTKLDLEDFHDMAKVPAIQNIVKRLCNVGRSIISMMTTDDEILFRFECMADGGQSMAEVLEQLDDHGECFDESSTGTLSSVEHRKPEITVLLSRLGLQPSVEGNLFTNKSDWPCLPGARRPRDPTMVDRKEDYCTCCGLSQQCTCISRLPRNRHRVAIGPRDKRIVIASLPENAKGAVYEAGSYIGELVGDLYPPMHPECDDMFFELPKSGQSCTAHLHWTKTANWTCLVSHSCSPCASFTVKTIGGRVRVMLHADGPIETGTIITADYRGFSGDVHKFRDCMYCEGPCKHRST